jgi:spore coat polysaccharide biosynthesis protein SpsF
VRTVALVTARLASSRLPRKALADLGGRPVLQVLVERLRLARRPEAIVLATTTEPEDDELAAFAEQLGIGVHRGETRDILARWLGAAHATGADLLVCCDGDDVLCDPVYADRVVACFEKTGADYVTCEGLPFGVAPTGVGVAGLARVCANKTLEDTEGQGRFFEDARLIRRATVHADEEHRHDGARMTLDYPEDLEFFAAVLDGLRAEGPTPPLERIVAFLHEHPEVVAINAHRQEEYWERFHRRYPALEEGKA